MVMLVSLKLKRKLSKSGNSLVLRIPKDIENQLGLTKDTQVFIWVENGRIVLEPIKNKN